MLVKADLHIHSCLSPCGSLEMSPKRIVETAIGRGLGIIGITDHNSTKNCVSTEAAAERAGHEKNQGIHILPGIEITTIEEVHLLAYFPDTGRAGQFGECLYEHLPERKNDPLRFGDQVYVDEMDIIVGEVEKYLGNAIDLSLEKTVDLVSRFGGFSVPAHIDRPYHGVTAQLGFIPDLPFAAVEIVSPPPPALPRPCPVIVSSDAHHPEDIGRRYISLQCDEDILYSSPFRAVKQAFAAGQVSTSGRRPHH